MLVCIYVGVGGWGGAGVCACMSVFHSDNDHTSQSHTLHMFHYVRKHFLLFVRNISDTEMYLHSR